MKPLGTNTLYLITFAFFLCLSFLSIIKLINFEKNIETIYETLEDTPVVISYPLEERSDKLIFIAHGFAGSTTFMRPIAIALAKAGFITIRFDFLGHGKHSSPYTGDITTVKGATQSFIKQTNSITNFYLNKYKRESGLIIGHSMASDIVIRAARETPQIKGVIGISTYSDAVTRTLPKNLLILNGQWELPLRTKAKDILEATGIENPIENKLYGKFQDGTARKAVAVKNSDHIGILYSSNTQREIIDWINQLSPNNVEIKPNRIGLWAGVLFLDLLILFILSLKFLPTRQLDRYKFKFWRFLLGCIIASLITPYVLNFYTPNFVPFPVHNHLISHLLLMSILLTLLIPIKLNKSLMTSFNLPVFAFLFIFFTFVLGNVLNSYVSSFYLSESRIKLFLFLAIGCVPLMVVIQYLYQADKYGWVMGNLIKLFFIISISISTVLNFNELFILGYAVILLIAFSMIFGFLSNLLNRKYNNLLSVGLANGLVLSWTFATTLPTYVP